MEYSFCPQCGALVCDTVCPQCGAQLGDACIKSVDEEVINPDTFVKKKYEDGAVKKEKNSGIGWIIMAVAGVVAVLFVLVLVASGSFVFLILSNFESQKDLSGSIVQNSTSTSSSTQSSSGSGSSGSSSSSTLPTGLVTPLEGMEYVPLTPERMDEILEEASYYEDEVVTEADFILVTDVPDFFAYGHTNMPRTEFEGIYYNYLGDSFDYNQDYSVDRHSFSYIGDKDGIEVYGAVNYYSLTGDSIPNLEEINATLYAHAMNPLMAYLDDQTSYDETTDISFGVDCFVSYNDEQKISIVRYIQVYSDGYQEFFYMTADNIDLKNGEFLSAKDILDIDASFATKFKEYSRAQNGSDVEALYYLTDEELVDMLLNDDTNIIFFSPCGLEVGMNYAFHQSYSNFGWVTVTLNNFEDYVKDSEFCKISDPDNTTNICEEEGVTGPNPDIDEFDSEETDSEEEDDGDDGLLQGIPDDEVIDSL